MNPSRVLIAGNPNCGKTTLFNVLTKSREKTGNYSGVTVMKAEKYSPLLGRDVVDLPGAYSLSSSSRDEKEAQSELSRSAGCIINVMDSARIMQSLSLTLELEKLGIPMIVALNMADELEARGGSVDAEKLSARLGIPCVVISAKTGKGISALKKAVDHARVPPENRDLTPKRVCEGVLCVENGASRYALSDRIDAVLTHRVFGLPVFAALIVFAVILSFIAASPAEKLADAAFSALSSRLYGVMIRSGTAPFLVSLICGAVLPGVSGIIGFVPSLVMLFFFFSLLEDSGYMARAAFMWDGVFSRFGMTGKAAASLLVGLGCTVPAIASARTASSENERRRMILMLPFVPCGAKFPVAVLVSKAVFGRYAAIAAGCLYVFCILSALVFAALTKGKSGGAGFAAEIPPYRFPSVKKAAKDAARKAGEILKRIFTVVFLSSVAFWAAGYLAPDLSPAGSPEKSILFSVCGYLSVLTVPAGFCDARLTAALIGGILAKENIVSIISQLCAGSSPFSDPRTAVCFLVFSMLYTPCVSALKTVFSEGGGEGRRERRVFRLLALKVFLISNAYALAVSGILGSLLAVFQVP